MRLWLVIGFLQRRRKQKEVNEQDGLKIQFINEKKGM